MLLLETELPDELMAGGPSSWEQQMVTNKPPAQGPGPGQIYSNAQMNGGDEAIVPPNVASLQRQQQQQQHLAHLLQQGQKNPMVGNPHLNQLTNKSGPNVTAVMNNLGVSNMTMSMAPNNNGTNAMTMQGKLTLELDFFMTISQVKN